MPKFNDDDVRDLYAQTAHSYNQMMDAEIGLPMYADFLEDLTASLQDLHGALLDSSCGTGHMLEKISQELKSARELIGVDLSPEMVQLATQRLAGLGKVQLGDMRAMPAVKDDHCAAVVNFFAIHHVDPEGFIASLKEWARVLKPHGKLFLAVWEGVGNVDYSGQSAITARRYTEEALRSALGKCGFKTVEAKVLPIEGFDMDALYLIAE